MRPFPLAAERRAGDLRLALDGAAGAEDKGGDPAQMAHLVQAPAIHDDGGGHAEAHQIGQAVELCPEAAVGAEQPRRAAVQHVQDAGADDEGDRDLPLAVDGEADGGNARGQRQQGDRAGHQLADRDVFQPLKARAAFSGSGFQRSTGFLATGAPCS